MTGGYGADKGCECVGYQAHDPQGHEHPNATMNNLFRSVRATGAIGVVGVFVPEDPNSPDPLARKGQLAIDWGLFFQKGLRIGAAPGPVDGLKQLLRTAGIDPERDVKIGPVPGALGQTASFGLLAAT